MDNIEARVRKIVAEQLGVAEADIKNESSFVEDLGADSLDNVELVMALEEEFETEIPDEAAEKITNVQQAIDLPNFGSLNGPTVLEEKRFPPALVTSLRARGAEVREQPLTSGVQAVQAMPDGWFGGADPRRDGVVVGE